MTTAPLSNLTATWNASGTTFNAIKMNVTDTASAAASLLLDLQVGGVSRFSIRKDGATTVATKIAGGGFTLGENGSGAITVRATGLYGWSNDNTGGTAYDLTLARDAADTLAQRNGTNAQTFRVYNTFTDASNFERLNVMWSSNIAFIETLAVGTGTPRSLIIGTNGAGTSLQFMSAGTTRFSLTGTGHFLATADNTYDIGASGANRPRDVFVARNLWGDGSVTGGQNAARIGVGGVVAASSVSINFSSTTGADGSVDVSLFRDAADTLAQRRTTNPQTFRVYNTFTDASNYERGRITWESNTFVVGAQAAGTGTNRTTYLTSSGGTSAAQVRIGTDASGGRIWFTPANLSAWEMTSSGHFLAGADNTYDIGASGASRPRNAFWAGYQEMSEMTAPAAPATNNVRIYAVDNGSGKTQLMALFATGAAVQIAIEP